MDTIEYIAVLWRVIGGLCIIIAGLIGALWRHVLEDRKIRRELQRCKDALGLNGDENEH
jgi:hypothetical protein